MSKAEPALEPALTAYAEAHARGGGVVWMKRVSDLETPVSAMLKLGADKPGSFLLESVQGGDFRGRYSIIGLKPDLVWRVRDGRAEASRGGFGDSAFRAQRDAPLKSLRKLLTRSALDLPSHLPPMAAGLFGYLGYDMVRLVEKLPEKAADPIGTPQALLVRPTIVAVFDNVTGEITLITPARKRAGQSAEAAYGAARERLERVWRALDRPLAKKRGGAVAPETVEPKSNTTPDAYRALVGKCKQYCRAGDVFQVVPSQRFSAPLNAPPFALYRSLRRLNPSPFLYYLNFADFAVVGSSPEILV
ncbi:MAG: chorismate-binding protein, partial [Hyphomonadaceae bacterium]|nr:chorismate-binding protein [Hyphomonadaceae bacterium]